jgi:hypothetical protein
VIFACDSRATRRGPRWVGGGSSASTTRTPQPCGDPSSTPRRASGIPALGALADARSCRLLSGCAQGMNGQVPEAM